jgi:hypothetical protein
LSIYGYKQFIKQPTRITKNTSTIIDIIASNKENIKRIKVIPTTFSDHDMVAGLRKLNHQKFAPREIKCRDFSKYNHYDINRDLQNANWQDVYNSDDANQAVSAFNSILTKTFNTRAPLIKKRVKGRPCLWLDAETKSKMNERDRQFRKYRKGNSEENKLKYKRL